MRHVLFTLALVRGSFFEENASSVFANQARYFRLGAAQCHRSAGAAAVERLQALKECPSKWAVSCLDHFNCESILREDVVQPMVSALKQLGMTDVWTGRVGECNADCASRQHLVLNANLINPDWAAILPPSSVLVNVEQLVERSAEEARHAARIAMQVYATDAKVAAAGERVLNERVLNKSVLGTTVDDRRGFVPLETIASSYPWLDFSYHNLDLLHHHGVCAFPKGLGVVVDEEVSPQLDASQRDLDAVHLGGTTVPRRMAVIDELRRLGHSAFVVDGAFSHDRLLLLHRARLGLCIKRRQDRLVPEVPRILAYAKAGLPVLAESSTGGDMLLQGELSGSAVHFVNYDDFVKRAHGLLSTAIPSNELREAAIRLSKIRQERLLLAPALAFLFPACTATIQAHLPFEVEVNA